jgi:ABC-2 type transport system ATP-binding protein
MSVLPKSTMLKAEHLRKQFTTILAVDDVSLEVHRGSVFGLIGPNGAGKSTTIRMLLNIIKPDAGAIFYDGKPFDVSIQNSIGYLPEERGLYRKNGLLDTIVYFAALRGIDSPAAKKKGMEWLERFNLHTFAKRKVEELSKGNQQKVQFITAILHDPEWIVLDEPFSGLDPVNQIMVKDIFAELKQRNKAIIFSTHQMESAEKLSDEICLINHGQIVLEGTVKSVKQKFGTNAVRLEYSGNGSFLAKLPFVNKSTIYENYAELMLHDGVSTQEILKAISSKIELRKFEYVEPSLNSIFLDVVGSSVEQIEKESTDTVKPASLPSIKHPEIKKQQLSLVLGAFMTVIGTILVLSGKDMWVLLVAGVFASVVSFIKLQKLKQQLPKEYVNE